VSGAFVVATAAVVEVGGGISGVWGPPAKAEGAAPGATVEEEGTVLCECGWWCKPVAAPALMAAALAAEVGGGWIVVGCIAAILTPAAVAAGVPGVVVVVVVVGCAALLVPAVPEAPLPTTPCDVGRRAGFAGDARYIPRPGVRGAAAV
jgi:hypothetical protein